jgi:hypothetical protein
MTIFELENKRKEFLSELQFALSSKQILTLIIPYFDLISQSDNPNILHSYITEIKPIIIKAIEEFDPFYSNPSLSELLLNFIHKLQSFDIFADCRNELNSLYDKISAKLEILLRILAGDEINSPDNNKLLFPVIEISRNNSLKFGFLESITIKLSKTSFEDKFLIIPSSEKIENQINQQITTSWKIARDYVSQKRKRISRYHEVIIHFDNRMGIYTGNSLGIALTIGFIEQLLKLYNAPYLIKIKQGTVSTGGVDVDGNITGISEEIIADKVELVFFSNSNQFIIPSEDKPAAIFRMNELKKDFPGRNLYISGIDNLNDLLNRRNLVDIKKQNPIKRSAKSIRRNWGVTLLLLILIAIIGFFFAKDYDNNPAVVENIDNTFFIKTIGGKILWEKGNNTIFKTNDNRFRTTNKIVDINNDGKNEVLITHEKIETLKNKNEAGRIACFNYKNELIWKYNFKDLVKSKISDLDSIYLIRIIDTVTERGNKELLVWACNGNSFASAIFKLDLRTGKRLPGTMWISGWTFDAVIDSDKITGERFVIIESIDNGFEQVITLGVKLTNIDGCCPTTSPYQLLNLKLANLMYEIRLPKTDYLKIKNGRYNLANGISYYPHAYSILVNENPSNEISCINYLLNYNLKQIDIVILDNFRVLRDSAVNKGILNPPLTESQEYTDLLKSQILKWDNGKWIKWEDQQ